MNDNSKNLATQNKQLFALPRFYPYEISPSVKWINFYYTSVKEMNEKSGIIVEPVDDGNGDYWSVYLKTDEGLSVCVADVATEIQASDLGKVILNAAEQFKTITK